MMSVHHIQGWSAQRHSGVMVSIGRHPNWGTQPPLGLAQSMAVRLGHPLRLKARRLVRWRVRTLECRLCSKEIFAMDILAEIRFTFRPGQTVKPFAMVSGKTGGSLPRRVETRSHSCRQFEAQEKCAVVSVFSVQAKPCQKILDSAGLAARAGQCSTTCTTVSVSVPHNRHEVSFSARTHRDPRYRMFLRILIYMYILQFNLLHQHQFVGIGVLFGAPASSNPLGTRNWVEWFRVCVA